MKKYLAVIPVGMALLTPSVAQADMSECRPSEEKAYSKAYRKVVKHMGKSHAGRDIRFKGVRFMGHSFPPTCHDIRRTTKQLTKLLTPTPYLANIAVSPRQPPAGVRLLAHKPVGLAACIVSSESRHNPQANNGSHFGIAQWTVEAWLRHGGGAFASSPLGATYEQQLLVLSNGLVNYGCQDWCPFDPC